MSIAMPSKMAGNVPDREPDARRQGVTDAEYTLIPPNSQTFDIMDVGNLKSAVA